MKKRREKKEERREKEKKEKEREETKREGKRKKRKKEKRKKRKKRKHHPHVLLLLAVAWTCWSRAVSGRGRQQHPSSSHQSQGAQASLMFLEWRDPRPRDGRKGLARAQAGRYPIQPI